VDTVTVITIAVVIFFLTFALPALVGMTIVGLVGRRFGRAPGATVAAALIVAYLLSILPRIAVFMIFIAVPPAQGPLVRVDLALSRPQREAIAGMAIRGELPAATNGGLEMPWWADGLSVDGMVDLVEDPCGDYVFFMTLRGFSPDPYGGFELVPPGCEPEVDPLGSGQGQAEALGDGWYWITAS
jgi:hypothetical protein